MIRRQKLGWTKDLTTRLRVPEALIKDLEMLLSPAAVNPPTDNTRQERFYRTAKQKEIHSYASYPSLEITGKSIGEHIEFNNEMEPYLAPGILPYDMFIGLEITLSC